MKPDTGFEMEEEPYDPRELFADIALLITEARTPDRSKKGRVEGPHCPPVQGGRGHDCDRHKEQCRKASDILTQHKILLRNNIPMRIDVLLFPSCEHGLREETVVVGAMFSTVDAFVLLERWDIQLIHKRSPERLEGYVGGRSLLQAVRSYLHFSQLSSWLISKGGALPLRVVYRVYAPGESVGYTFERPPEIHNFPAADLGEAMMRASVTHMPRQSTMMSLFCRSPSPGIEQHTRLRKTLAEERSQSPDLKAAMRKSPELKGAMASKLNEDHFGYSPPGASNRKHSKDFMEYGKQNETELYDRVLSPYVTDRPPSGRKMKDTKQRMKEKDSKLMFESEMDPFHESEVFKMDALSSVIQECEILQGHAHKKETYPSNIATRLPSNKETKMAEIASDKLATRFPSNQEAKLVTKPPMTLQIKHPTSTDMKTARLPGQMSPQKSHPYRKPVSSYSLASGSHPIPFSLTKRLPSPKVLMTASKKPPPSGYSKRCLDYSEENLSQDTIDDFSSLKHLQELTPSNMQDLTRPLSPNQLNAYLSSLSNKPSEVSSLSQLDEIPMTKCRFFIGETDKLNVDEVFESPEIPTEKLNKVELSTQGEDLKCTTQSLSENIPARADNSSISSLSRERTDNSELPSLSEKRMQRADNVESTDFKGDNIENTDFEVFEEADSYMTTLKKKNLNNSSIQTEIKSNSHETNEDDNNRHVDASYEECKPVNLPTRRLFHKSLSTSEVEDDLTTRKSLKKVIHKLKVESRGQEAVVDNIQNTPHSRNENLKPDISQSQSLKSRNTDSVLSDDLYQIEGKNDRKARLYKEDEKGQSSGHVKAENRKPIRHNLDDIAIPCSVGSGTNEEPDHVPHKSNSIQICAKETKNSSQNGFFDLPSQNGFTDLQTQNGTVDISPVNRIVSPKSGSHSNSEGSPTPISGSPNVDEEVLQHLKQSVNQSSPRQTSLRKGSNSDLPDIGLSLCKQLLRKGFQQSVESETRSPGFHDYKNLPTPDDIQRFQFNVARSASALFNSNTGLPSRSSPAPMKRKSSGSFDYDCTLTNVKAIKNAVSCSRLSLQCDNKEERLEDPKIISTSAPASTNCLLGNFEESMLNGRLEPVGVVDGFTVEIGAGGSFCPKHVTLPVAAYFFQLSDDNAPSPYLGHVNLDAMGKRGYHIPRTGTVQVTLFNPNKTVVKMFVVMYDLSDMPPSCQTFLRQRTMYMPVNKYSPEPSFLRYLIHLRFASTKSGKIYLHTDIRLIFARDKFEFDPRVANYELRSFTEGPENPKFSPKR